MYLYVLACIVMQVKLVVVVESRRSSHKIMQTWTVASLLCSLWKGSISVCHSWKYNCFLKGNAFSKVGNENFSGK